MSTPNSAIEALHQDASMSQDFLEYSRYQYLLETLETAELKVRETHGHNSHPHLLIERAQIIACRSDHTQRQEVLDAIKNLFSLHFAAYYNSPGTRMTGTASALSRLLIPAGSVAGAALLAVLFAKENGSEVPEWLTVEGVATTSGVLSPANLLLGVTKGINVRGKVRRVLRKSGIQLGVITKEHKLKNAFTEIERKQHPEYFITYVERVLNSRIDEKTGLLKQKLKKTEARIRSIEGSIEIIRKQEGAITNRELALHIVEAKAKLAPFLIARDELVGSIALLGRSRSRFNAKASIYQAMLDINSVDAERRLEEQTDQHDGRTAAHVIEAGAESMLSELDGIFLQVEATLDSRDFELSGTNPDYQSELLAAEIAALNLASNRNIQLAVPQVNPGRNQVSRVEDLKSLEGVNLEFFDNSLATPEHGAPSHSTAVAELLEEDAEEEHKLEEEEPVPA